MTCQRALATYCLSDAELRLDTNVSPRTVDIMFLLDDIPHFVCR